MIVTFINRILFKIKNKTCTVKAGVIVHRNTRVGKNCYLSKNSSLSKNVILGDNVRVGENCKLRNIKIGNNSMIESGVKVVGTGKEFIIIGKECYIGVNNILDTSDSITIGDFVHIAGPSTALWCHTSVEMCMNSIPLDDVGRDKYRPTKPIIVENNVYIGGNSTIYPGVTISNHSIVAPNSAVDKDIKSNTLVGGVPATKIKKLN